MKKIMMIAAMMVAAISANAQNEVGQLTLMPKAGINISTITGDGINKKSKVGLVAGIEAEYGISEKFGLQFGLLYSMEGYKGKGIAVTGQGEQIGAYIADAKFNFDYLNIPILAQYYVIKGLAVKAGIQPAFNVRGKWSVDGNSGKMKDIGYEPKAFNFSIPVGLSYEYQNFVLDARYNIGVTKLVKDADQGRNSTFAITLGYKFAL
jgi:hypothetical protein